MVWTNRIPTVERTANVTIGLNRDVVPQEDLLRYTFMMGWYWFDNNNLTPPDEGWKLHVSCNLDTASRTFAALLPMLRNSRISHKFLGTPEAIANQDGAQTGKALAIYPENINHAFGIVQIIDVALQGIVSRNQAPVISNELAVGQTVVYTRYGAFNSAILNENGVPVNDTFGQIHPSWIQNPWTTFPNVPPGVPPWPPHPVAARRVNGQRGR